MRKMFSKNQIKEISIDEFNLKYSANSISINSEIEHEAGGNLVIHLKSNIFPLAFQIENEDDGEFIIVYYDFATGLLKINANSDYTPDSVTYIASIQSIKIVPASGDDYSNFNTFQLKIYSLL